MAGYTTLNYLSIQGALPTKNLGIPPQTELIGGTIWKPVLKPKKKGSRKHQDTAAVCHAS